MKRNVATALGVRRVQPREIEAVKKDNARRRLPGEQVIAEAGTREDDLMPLRPQSFTELVRQPIPIADEDPPSRFAAR